MAILRHFTTTSRPPIAHHRPSLRSGVRAVRPPISDRRPLLLGFTLIELLIVIAIIGLLATLAAFAVRTVRQKARDSARVADIRQIRNALELFATKHSGYPFVGGSWVGMGTAQYTCFSDPPNVFSDTCSGEVYMANLPSGVGGSIATFYTYHGEDCDSDVCRDYRLFFTLEGKTADFPAGQCAARSAGVSCPP